MTTILIVEDVEMNIMLLNAGLKEYDARCVVARTGVEAVQLYEQLPHVNLILMDIHLPEMNGLAATSYIYNSDAYQRNPVPIIAVTGDELSEPKEEFLKRTGMVDYITKPLTKEKIGNAIAPYIDKHSAQRQSQ